MGFSFHTYSRIRVTDIRLDVGCNRLLWTCMRKYALIKKLTSVVVPGGLLQKKNICLHNAYTKCSNMYIIVFVYCVKLSSNHWYSLTL